MRQRTIATAVALSCVVGLVGGLAPMALAAPGEAAPSAPSTAKEPSKPTKPKPQPVVDFNGDGHHDLIVTQPRVGVGGSQPLHFTGALGVVYGSAKGLNPAKRQLITQEIPGIPGTSEGYDYFGHRTASADYDGDGFTDLAISSVGEDLTVGGSYRRNAGQIVLVWGGKNGLTKHGATTAKQSAPTSIDVRRGASLAVGDFNGDGRMDLATGDHSLGRGGEVLYGPISRGGKPKSVINLGIKDGQPAVGVTLDAGDITGDGITDLVIQVNGNKLPISRIEIHRGTKKGLVRSGKLTDARGALLLSQSMDETRVAVGDLDRDGHADIALGQQYAGQGTVYGGQVTVVYGGPKGQSTLRDPQVITQDTPGVPDEAEGRDAFGYAVAVGDINADGIQDLAVGAPGEDNGELTDTGQVTTLLGSKKGLTGQGARVYHQGTPGMPSAPVAHQAFGAAVRLLDVTKDGRADLAVGSQSWGAGGKGRASFLPTAKDGAVTGTGAQEFGPGDLGLYDEVLTGFGDRFGD
ncbi:FG-GAP and VCBS repeat-containing protein [Streptomyces sp. NPDC057638]|uniref:FG-GAP and VCBS repeat-containing protein n=1 Tax=Streptomyces sp. NPDC057638 TaxID=3346190 RepID=UPI0036A50113